MIEAVSCGGIVIYKWKILLLYKNQNGRYMGWVLPKGTVEEGETYRQTALREVKKKVVPTVRLSNTLVKRNILLKAVRIPSAKPYIGI